MQLLQRGSHTHSEREIQGQTDGCGQQYQFQDQRPCAGNAIVVCRYSRIGDQRGGDCADLTELRGDSGVLVHVTYREYFLWSLYRGFYLLACAGCTGPDSANGVQITQRPRCRHPPARHCRR